MIHPLAFVDPTAQLAVDVEVGPFSFIGSHVYIGAGTIVGSHVMIRRDTQIGERNRIHAFVSLGDDPQDKSYHQEPTFLEIGDDNVVREYSSIHRGTTKEKGVTRLGHRNYLMSYTHIAHDCEVGNDTCFINNASIAGHVRVHDFATLGSFTGVHQFCVVGEHSFIVGSAMVSKDVLPCTLVSGVPAKVSGLNQVGLQRRGLTAEMIRTLREAYSIIYRQNLSVVNAITALQPLAEQCSQVRSMMDMLSTSKRGIVR